MVRVFSVLVVLLVPAALHAHPVPKDNHDRTVAVHLTPDGVVVDYRLELDERRAILDVRREALEGVETPGQFHEAFRKHFAPLLADGLGATLDGEELTFRCVEQRSVATDHLRCDFRFLAAWKLSPDRTHQFRFYEGNYPLDSSSRLAVRLSHSPKLTLDAVTAPDADLIATHPDLRKPGDDRRLRSLAASVLAVPSYEGVIRAPMTTDFDEGRPPPEGPSPYASTGKWQTRGHDGHVKTAPPPADPAPDEAPAQTDAQPSLWEVLRRSKVEELFDTRLGLALMLALALGFGAAHALTPGHGKALVAAYLVGQHGTVWHAVVLGLVVTLTHTGSVILLAVLLATTGLSDGVAAVVLNLVGGLLIVGLGAWLLMKRLMGGADHVHLGGGHEAPDLTRQGASWWTTVTMGMVGGIVPCWDAIILLLIALATKRLWMGVVLLLAFSAGLAAVLVLLGLLVVAARSSAGALVGERRFERVARLLPIASAVAIIAIGLLMTFGSVRAGG